MSFRQRASLDSVCSIIADCPHSTPFWTDSGFLVIRNQNIKNGKLDLSERSYTDHKHYLIRIRRAKPQFGDLIFTREAPMGDICMVPEGLECCVGQRQVLLRPNPEKVVPRYLLYAIQSPEVQHEISWSEGTGSTVSNVRIPVLKSIKIPLLPLKEQAEAATLLGALDDRITLLRETNATLEAIAQALFKSWFVDIDPVHAKQQGRAPEGMDEATAALFPDRFEGSDMGLVPKGWRICRVSDVTRQIFSGGTPDTRKPEYWFGDLPWFSSGETRERVIVDTEKKINLNAVKNSSTKLALPGDILIASAGQGHTRGQTSYCSIKTYINQSVVSVRADSERCDSLWLFYNLSRRYAEMRDLSDSHSSRGSLTTKLLAGMCVVLPELPVLQAFGAVASVLMESQANNLERIATLSGIRDTLLPRLISGQLRLPEAS